MIDPDHSNLSAPPQTPDPAPRVDRRAALKNIGALAGSAPAITLLLTPSATRAKGYGGSPCEGDRHSHCSPGRGHGNDRPGNGFGWGHQPGHGGFGRGHDRDQGDGKPAGRES